MLCSVKGIICPSSLNRVTNLPHWRGALDPLPPSSYTSATLSGSFFLIYSALANIFILTYYFRMLAYEHLDI